MSDDLGIKLSVEFEKFDNINGKLQTLVKKLQDNNKISLQIDNNMFNNMQKQIDSLQKMFSKGFNLDTNNVDGSMKELTNKIGELSKKQIKIVDDKEIQYIEQIKKSILETQKVLMNFKSGKITEVNTLDFDKARSTVYKEVNNLQNEEFSIKQRLIGAEGIQKQLLEQQLKVIREQQDLSGKLINDYNLKEDTYDKSVLMERTRLTNELAISQDKYNQKLAEERKQVNETIRQYQKSKEVQIQNLNTKYREIVPKDQLDAFQKSLYKLNATDLGNLKNELKDIDNQFDRLVADTKSRGMITGQRDNMGMLSQVQSIFGKVSTWFGVTTVFMGAIHQFQDAISTIVSVNTEMVSLKKVTNETAETYKSFVNDANNVGQSLGKQTTEVIRATTAWVKAGESLGNAKKLAETTLVGSNVGDVNVDQMQTYLVAPLKAWNIESTKSIKILDIMNNVSNQHAVKIQDLGEGYSRASSVMAMANNTLEETTALITSAQAKTQLGGDTIGNGLRTIALRLTQMKDDEGNIIPKLGEDLAGVGVKLKDANGNLYSTYNIIKQLSNVWSSIDEDKQLNLLDKMAGKQRSNVLAAIITNFSEAEKTLSDSLDSQGSAMREQAEYMKGIEYSTSRFKEQVVELYMDLTNTDFIKSIVDTGSSAIKVLDDMTKSFGTFPSLLSVASLGLLTFNKSFRELATTKFPLNNMIKEFTTTYKTAITQSIERTMRLKQAVETFGGSTVGLTAKIQALKASQIALSVSSMALQAALTMGIGLAVGALITGLTSLIDKAILTKKELKEMNEEITTSGKETVKTINDVNALLDKSSNLEFEIGNAKTVEESKKLKEDLLKVQRDLAIALPESTSGFDDEGQAISTNNALIREMLDLKKQEMILNAQKFFDENGGVDNIEKQAQAYAQLKKEVNELELAKAQGKKTVQSTVKYQDQGGNEQEVVISTNVAKALEEKNKAMQDYTKLASQAVQNANILNKYDSQSIEVTRLYSSAIQEQTKKTEDNTKAKEDNKKATPERNYDQEYKNTADSIEKMTSNLEFYNKALKELDDSGLSGDTFNKMLSDYPQLLGYVGNETELRKEINKLIGDEETAQQTAYNKMLGLSEDYYNSKIKGNTDMQNQLTKLYSLYANNLSDGYTIDLSNYRNLEQAKASISTSLINNLAGAWSKYWNTTLNDFDAMLYYAYRYNDKATAELNGIRDKMRGLTSGFDQITVAPIGINLGKVGTGSSGSSSSQKDIADIDLKTDRYYNLEKAIDRVNDALDRNKALQEQVNGKEKTRLMQEEISLLAQKQKAIENLKVAEQQELAELESRLSNNGFSINDGEITNLNARLQALQNSANSKSGQGKEDAINNLKDLEEATKRYIDLMNNELPNSDKEWLEVGNAIKQAQEDMLNSLKETQEKMTEVIKAEVEKRKKAIDDELDKKKKALEEEKNLYNKQNAEDDYKSNLAKEQQKLMEIQDSIDRMSRVSTAQGKAKLEELMQEYKAQQEKIDEMIRNNQRDRINEQFEEEQKRLEEEAQKKKDEIDKKYDDKTIAQIALQAITNGFYEFEGEIINTQNAMSDFLNETGESLLANGQLIQKEMIDKLKEAAEIIKNLGSINISLGVGANGVPSYAVGTTYLPNDGLIYAHKGEAILSESLNPFNPSSKFVDILRQQIMKSLPRIPSPIGQPKGNGTFEFNEPFIVIQGNVTEDVMPQVKSVVDSAIKDLKRLQQEQFQAQGIY